MLRPTSGSRFHPPHHSHAAIFALHVYQGKCARKNRRKLILGHLSLVSQALEA